MDEPAGWGMRLLREMTWLDITEIIRALAALGWPILAIVVVLTFRNQVRALFRGRRIKSWKGFGQEVELERKLSALARATDSLPLRLRTWGRYAPETLERGDVRFLNLQTHRRAGAGDVLAEAGASPKAALVLLGSQLDHEVRRLLATARDEPGAGAAGSISDWVGALRASGAVPGEILDALVPFREIRNRITHGREADDDDALRAIDIGMRLLDALRALPETPDRPPHDLRREFKAE